MSNVELCYTTLMRQKIYTILAMLLIIGSGPFALAQSLTQNKDELQGQIEDVLNTSHAGALNIPAEKAKQAKLETTVQTAQQRMAEITREKREVRLKIAEQKALAAEFELHYNIEPTDTDALFTVYVEQQARLQEFITQYARLVALRDIQESHSMHASVLQIVSDTPYVSYDQIAAQKVLLASQEKLTQLAERAQSIPNTMAALSGDHSELLAQYHAAEEEQKNARFTINLSKTKLVEIQRIMDQVEERVRLMQLEMSRIDETLRMKAEQDLVSMGLKTGVSTIVSRKDSFIWPVVGRITATFMDKGYQAFFGVPHKAIDIAAPQSTPIKVAADGIVYYVKFKGDSSYAYVLVGHRNGYATLYGHLSGVAVAKGDTVRQGQVIGYGGGMPGTVGAGPMTTGPHLHFETILNGTHVDPLGILPKEQI